MVQEWISDIILLMQEGAPTSVILIRSIPKLRASHTAQSLTSQIRSRTEYLTSTEEITVLLRHRKNLSHWQALMRFIDDSVAAYLFGPP